MSVINPVIEGDESPADRAEDYLLMRHEIV